MKDKRDNDEEVSTDEAARVRDEIVRRMIATPPTSQKDKPKKKRKVKA